jgi:hypothetical protein
MNASRARDTCLLVWTAGFDDRLAAFAFVCCQHSQQSHFAGPSLVHGSIGGIKLMAWWFLGRFGICMHSIYMRQHPTGGCVA